MSIFPTGRPANGQRAGFGRVESRLEAEGALVRPISGQIYLIEEEDLESLADSQARPSLSGLVSRH